MDLFHPTIGIALAAYQPHLSYFIEQLSSIQKQTFQDWVCAVTFDSPLATYTQNIEMKPFFDDPRFLFSENPVQLGHKKNFEHAGNLLSKQFPNLQYLAYADQDDLWYPEKLAAAYLSLQSIHTPYRVFHSDMHILVPRQDGFEIMPDSVWKYEGRQTEGLKTADLLMRNQCTGASMLISMDLIKAYPEIPAAFAHHDHWYAVLALELGTLISDSRCLYAYRQHGNNVVGANRKASIFELRKKWALPDFIKHLQHSYQSYTAMAEALPFNVSVKHQLNSGFAITGALFRAITSNHLMTARSALSLLLGALVQFVSALFKSDGSHPSK